MDTSGNQVSKLDDIECYCENVQVDVHAIYTPGIDNPLSPTASEVLVLGGSAENTILLDEEEDKENSPPKTPVSERSLQPPAKLRNPSFGTKIEIVPD